MKINVTKEQTLKALLLVALAGNQAMWIAGFSAADALKAVDLSSEVVTSGANAATTTAVSPLSTSPNALTLNAAKLQTTRVPVVTRGSGKAVAETTAKAFTGAITICEVPLSVLFEEIIESGQRKTRITLTEKDAKDGKFTTSFKVIGAPAELGITREAPNAKAKKETDNLIAQTGQRELEAANRCGEPGEEGTAPEEREPAPRARAPRRTRVAGKNSEQIRRSINRIGALGDISDENESRGRAKNERELERLVKSDLYPSLKSMLMAKGARSEEGLALLDDAIEELESLGSEGQIDNRRVTRLASTLKGLKYGAETYRRVQEFSEETRALKEDFANTRSQGGQILPEQYQQYQELQSRMQQEIVMGPVAQFSQYRGYMSQTDMNYFMQPYQNLQREMQTLMNPGAPGLGGQIANVPGAGFPGGLNGGFGGGFGGTIANVPGGIGGVGGGLGPAIPMNNLGGLGGGIGGFGAPGIVPGSPFNNPTLLNRPTLGAPIPLNTFGGVPSLGVTQPILAQPPFLQSGIVANVPAPTLGAPMPSPLLGAPLPTFGSPIVPMPATPFSAPVPTINRAPLVATNSFGYGSPSPFLMNQPSVFSSTIAQPQIYANTLPAQAIVTPPVGPGSLGAYANFSLNVGAPSIFATPVGPIGR